MMNLSTFATFFISCITCFTCPENWSYETSSGECVQTSFAIVCTGNSLVVVAKVEDLYFNLPANQEPNTRLQIGSCTGNIGPTRRLYIESFDLDECNPVKEEQNEGIKLTWEVTGSPISGFDDVYKYEASCHIWSEGGEDEIENIEMVSVAPDINAALENAEPAEITSELNLEFFEDQARSIVLATASIGKKIYGRLSGAGLPENSEFYLENLVSYENLDRTGNSFHIVKDFCKTTLLEFAPSNGELLLSTNKVLDFEFNAFAFDTTTTFYIDVNTKICLFTDNTVDVSSCTPTPSCSDGYSL